MAKPIADAEGVANMAIDLEPSVQPGVQCASQIDELFGEAKGA